MASRQTLLHCSQILTNTLLGGHAGLLRESGLTDVKSGRSSAWGQGLEHRRHWRRSKEYCTNMEPTSIVYDETLEVALIGLKAEYGRHTINEM